ncbi:MAG: mechanosensitive ion channel family protein [bacterium]|nr:mechanosensitive ion channel family protein [bacterium]
MRIFWKYILLCLILGSGLFFIEFLKLPVHIISLMNKVMRSLLVFSIAFPIIKSSNKYCKNILKRIDGDVVISSLISNIIKIFLFIIVALIILNIFDISIAPILATLGIGGLTIALALKDTLADFFAGFYLIALRQIKIGNYIEFDSGERGYVADINWRNTQLRLLGNNLVLIPNSKVMSARITNYDLPGEEMSVLVQVGVHYKSDLELVERVTVEIAKEIMETVEGGVRNSDPFIRFHTFNHYTIDFSVILRAQNFVSQYLIKHEFIKRLQKRYIQENIVMPFPIVAVNRSQEDF